MVEPRARYPQCPYQVGEARPGKRAVYVGLFSDKGHFDEPSLCRGHRVAEKDYRFKIGTIGEKKPQDWIVVEQRHEPLIDCKSFAIVQDKLKSRQRPRQNGETSLFAGLIKCGECGKSLTIRTTHAKHPQQIYACKTYGAFGKTHCSQHRVEYDTLYRLVLNKIRECAKAALTDGEAIAGKLTDTCEAEQKGQREALERSLAKDEERIEVLEKMVLRLYEDMVAGRISEANFNLMLDKTQKEQAELKARAGETRKKLTDAAKSRMTPASGWTPFRNMPTSRSWTQPP